MSDRTPTTALGWLDRALAFICDHPGWTMEPGQDFHGYLLQARRTLEDEQKKAVKMINTAMRIGGKDAAMLVEDEEVTILRGKVAELERQLWHARHDYGQAMQQNARHATTIAMMRKAQARTAEDERRDVLAFLDDEASRFASEGASIRYSIDRRQALQQQSSTIATVRSYIQRGVHVGAADREAVKP